MSDTCEIDHPAITFATPEGCYYPTGCPLCERNQIIAELRQQLADERARIDRRVSDVPRYDCVEDEAHRATMKHDSSGDWILFDEAMKAVESE